ncbi:hypothetical protein IR083_07725 [Dysgonomonas sp. GY75]|uniref:hypothetical protein n=1 Tax=Dysgonomonas sp. GY75 TaxID=2780419 RepID=UPI001883FF61|nr:hypothetical protein [Dysgonomonas sp. GY75]MBF0648706.1 hypothetical protein [Dysgonomonas sp. GY75]
MSKTNNSNTKMQPGENIAGLSDNKAYLQFLSDMKDESPMSKKERNHFVEILRQQGRKLNRLMEIPTLHEAQL